MSKVTGNKLLVRCLTLLFLVDGFCERIKFVGQTNHFHRIYCFIQWIRKLAEKFYIFWGFFSSLPTLRTPQCGEVSTCLRKFTLTFIKLYKSIYETIQTYQLSEFDTQKSERAFHNVLEAKKWISKKEPFTDDCTKQCIG